MPNDLHDFLSQLDRAGELERIREPISPICEVTRRADQASSAAAPSSGSPATARSDPEFHTLGGKALLFESIEGSDFPLLINAFGSYRRIEMALGGRPLDDIASTIAQLVKPEPPRSMREAFTKLRQFTPLLRIGPKRKRGTGPCQQVVRTGDDIDLTRLPMIRCWPLDGDFEAVGYPPGINDRIKGFGHPDISPDEWDRSYRGRYITLAGVHSIHADDRDAAKPRSHNIGMYRMQLLGKSTLAMHWHMHHDGAAHWRSWKRLGQPMPVAIVLGGESVMAYAATCPLPPGVSELLMAGYLNGRGIPLVRAQTVPLWIPANAEIVIEGFVSTEAGFPGWDPRETDEPLGPGAVFEGPFGDHTGFYSMPDRYPIMKVTAVTHRQNAVYPTTIVGLPPQEDYFLGKATERIMLPLLQTLIPDIVDYDLPMFGAFHNCACVQINKQYPLHARRVMHAIWGAGQMAWTKAIFVVDESVDVHRASEVLAACARWCNPSRDIETVNGALDILDHAAPRLGAGTKLGFDCTSKITGEEVGGIALNQSTEPPSAEACAADAARARTIDGVLEAAAPTTALGWLFIRVDRGWNEPGRAGLGQWVIAELFSAPTACPFTIVVGRDVDISNLHRAMFHWVANMDAGRDMVLDRAHDRVAFDSTPKTAADARNGEPVRAWPPVLEMDAPQDGSTS